MQFLLYPHIFAGRLDPLLRPPPEQREAEGLCHPWTMVPGKWQALRKFFLDECKKVGFSETLLTHSVQPRHLSDSHAVYPLAWSLFFFSPPKYLSVLICKTVTQQ